MKKKIHILTFWNEINYGAILQLHSLNNFLKKKNKVKIVKYINFRHLLLARIITIFGGFSIIKNLKKINLFNKFRKKFKFSKVYFNYNKFDIENIVFGSDEIWNLNHMFNKKDFTYFGNNFISKNLTSYAASIGNLKLSDLKYKQRLLLQNNLKKFKIITVRDYPSKMFLSKVGFSSKLVVDPIFFIKNFNLKKKKFIIVYGKITLDNKIEKIINSNSYKRHKIISIGFNNDWCDVSLINCEIYKFLNYFQNTSLVITNMLHGELFAIKFTKKLYRVNNSNKTNKFKHIFFHDLKKIKEKNGIMDTSRIQKVVKEETKNSEEILKKFFN